MLPVVMAQSSSDDIRDVPDIRFRQNIDWRQIMEPDNLPI